MKLFVGNLNFDTSDQDLQQAFAGFGSVQEAAVITDRDTGRSRGFGFVTMPNDDEAKAAIDAMDNSELDGRTLNVNEARPKGEKAQRRW